MGIELLLKIPREEGDRRIVDYDYNKTSNGEYVTFDCFSGATPDLISSVDSYFDWLLGFVEFYKRFTGEETLKLIYDDRMQGYDVWIYEKIPIHFRVDTNKRYLQFFYDNENLKDARKLVGSFIDIIWFGKRVKIII